MSHDKRCEYITRPPDAPGICKCYERRTIAEMQAKLEQAEKEKAELLETVKLASKQCMREVDIGPWNTLIGAIAKYEQSSTTQEGEK